MAANSVRVKNSRYSKGGITDEFSQRLGWWERYRYPTSRDDVTYALESKYHNRPDLLAYDLYGSPTYMWVILQYNNILDVTTEFVEGKQLTLPTPIRVKTEMT